MEERLIEKICDEFCDDFYDRQMYEQCINKAKEAFEIFMKQSVSKYRLWTCLIMIARSYNKLENVDKSIEYTLESIKYVETKDKEIEGFWTLARCYAIHNNLTESEHYFNMVINYYKETENALNLAKVYNMKAWYLKDIILAKESYKILKELKKIELKQGVFNSKSKVYKELEEVKDTLLELMQDK